MVLFIHSQSKIKHNIRHLIIIIQWSKRHLWSLILNIKLSLITTVSSSSRAIVIAVSLSISTTWSITFLAHHLAVQRHHYNLADPPTVLSMFAYLPHYPASRRWVLLTWPPVCESKVHHPIPSRADQSMAFFHWQTLFEYPWVGTWYRLYPHS